MNGDLNITADDLGSVASKKGTVSFQFMRKNVKGFVDFNYELPRKEDGSPDGELLREELTVIADAVNAVSDAPFMTGGTAYLKGVTTSQVTQESTNAPAKQTAGSIHECPHCGAQMIRKEGKNGGKPFLVCPNWKPNNAGCPGCQMDLDGNIFSKRY